jgi:hypothetical protein
MHASCPTDAAIPYLDIMVGGVGGGLNLVLKQNNTQCCTY